MTMEHIAGVVGVGKSTIGRDLEGNFPETGNLKRAKTATNPKGSSRCSRDARQSLFEALPQLANRVPLFCQGGPFSR
jgi:hypothetical protein